MLYFLLNLHNIISFYSFIEFYYTTFRRVQNVVYIVIHNYIQYNNAVIFIYMADRIYFFILHISIQLYKRRKMECEI